MTISFICRRFCKFTTNRRRANILEHQRYNKQRYDRNRRELHYSLDDRVFTKIFAAQGKLDPRYSVDPKGVLQVNHPAYVMLFGMNPVASNANTTFRTYVPLLLAITTILACKPTFFFLYTTIVLAIHQFFRSGIGFLFSAKPIHNINCRLICATKFRTKQRRTDHILQLDSLFLFYSFLLDFLLLQIPYISFSSLLVCFFISHFKISFILCTILCLSCFGQHFSFVPRYSCCFSVMSISVLSIILFSVMFTDPPSFSWGELSS